ncbi:protein lin-37 homolog [Hydractinia symbiolongicarpus]|uniref:protein lin-37 homolog n=1 Tax=Hydractinia symbiolongicarpus TaxID=13093 RepID=UPI00254B5A78|nr:protein lin-37 homolog [Hydractinia symbiolongicarpus]
MVREWMKNKPYLTQHPSLMNQDNKTTLPAVTQSENTDDCEDQILELTGPVKNEDQAYPRPLPPALKTALVEDIIDTESDIEELRKDNMSRWRKVRNRWKEHSFRQQHRYYESLQILRKSFNVHTGG